LHKSLMEADPKIRQLVTDGFFSSFVFFFFNSLC